MSDSFPVIPVPSIDHEGGICSCYYSQEWTANIYNCSSLSLEEVPISLPPPVNWMIISSNVISQLCSTPKYLHRIWHLDVSLNEITDICGDFIEAIHNNRSIKWLNLAGNQITKLNEQIKSLDHLEKIWLAGNPFHCDCSMTWMIQWLNNFTRPSGEHVIVDYHNVRCAGNSMKGELIYKLKEVQMGCYPKLSTGQKAGMGVGVVIGGAIIVCLLVIIFKGSREAKFLIYYYLKLDTVPKDDTNENVDDIEYDAFLCYR